MRRSLMNDLKERILLGFFTRLGIYDRRSNCAASTTRSNPKRIRNRSPPTLATANGATMEPGIATAAKRMPLPQIDKPQASIGVRARKAVQSNEGERGACCDLGIEIEENQEHGNEDDAAAGAYHDTEGGRRTAKDHQRQPFFNHLGRLRPRSHCSDTSRSALSMNSGGTSLLVTALPMPSKSTHRTLPPTVFLSMLIASLMAAGSASRYFSGSP